LHAHRLPLPRFPSHPDSIGVKLSNAWPNEHPVPDEELHAKLIVPDAGPLITLAAADSLDYLR